MNIILKRIKIIIIIINNIFYLFILINALDVFIYNDLYIHGISDPLSSLTQCPSMHILVNPMCTLLCPMCSGDGLMSYMDGSATDTIISMKDTTDNTREIENAMFTARGIALKIEHWHRQLDYWLTLQL